jgi:hypothetical protein
VLEQEANGGDEHAGVPHVVAAFNVLLGNFLVRLFDELHHVLGTGSAVDVQALAGTDVPEPGGRVRGLDADSDNLAGSGGVDCFADRLLEEAVRADHLVRGEGTHDGVRIAFVQDGGGKADGRAGILGLGLEDQVRVVEFRKLPAHCVAVRLSGDHQHPGAGQRVQPVIGGAQQCTARAGEVVKELGSCGSRQGPKAGPHAAGRDHCNEAVKG